MKVFRYLLFVACFFAKILPAFNISMKPESASLFVYEPFTILLETELPAAEIPEVSSGGGFSVTEILPVSAGKFRIEIIPEQTGTLTLPPFTFFSGDEEVQTPPFRFSVSAPRNANEMSLSLELSSTNLYADEPVKLTVTWSSKVPFTRCNQLLLDIPLLNDPAWEVYPLDPGVPENLRTGVPVNNRRVIAKQSSSPEFENQLIFAYMLVPRTAGIFRTPPAQMNCALLSSGNYANRYPSYFDNNFFTAPDSNTRHERIYLTAQIPALTVRELPAAGRMAYFIGSVGKIVPTAAIEPADAVVGQPMLLTLALTNVPFAPAIKAPPEIAFDGLTPEFQISSAPLHEHSGDGVRSFTYIVRALRAGISTVPAITLQTFDPQTGTYETVRTAPLPVEILPDGDIEIYSPVQERTEPPKTALTGIRNNCKESTVQMNLHRFAEHITQLAWIFWLTPVLIWFALRPWIRRRARCRNDIAYARAVAARRKFRCAVKHDEESAWKNYLADRFNLTAEAITFESVKIELRKNNTPENIIEQIRRHFKNQDAAEYSQTKNSGAPVPPVRRSPGVGESVKKFVRLLHKTIPFCSALFLITFAVPAQTPDDVFEKAMHLRTEQPDQAQPLFAAAALEFEARENFLNAGNSWFFAGENGRALANYLAAEQRNPFNRQIRESIAFIRTQRTDQFQIHSAGTGKISRAWQQFNRWAPEIRLMMLTLLWLAGWIVYIGACIAGKNIRHQFSIPYIFIALIPAASLIISLFQPVRGVIIQPTEARLGPGYAYDKAYDALLHESTEFIILEKQNDWIHARFPDGNDAWIRTTAGTHF